MTPITVDFETVGITPRPDYPPVPVGVSVLMPGSRPRYYAWGHPEGNNCTVSEVKKVLKKIWANKRPKLFHNAKFDIDVGNVHLGLPLLAWHQFHDTLFLAFLNSPHDQKLSLKPLADKYLSMPPDEQDAVRDWILENLRTEFSGAKGEVFLASDARKGHKIPPSKVGAYICLAPGGLVGKYANGDVLRTRKLYDLWSKDVLINRGMSEPYDRERKLMLVLLAQERKGININRRKLLRDVKHWEACLVNTDKWVRRRLKTPGLDIDKPEQLADALEEVGAVDEWILTDSGKRSTSKDNLKEVINDKLLLNVFAYRAKLTNTLRNFGRRWTVNKTDVIYMSWNQVRQSTERATGLVGARTGRLSSTPNVMNMPAKPPQIVTSKASVKIMQQLDREYLLLPPYFKYFAMPYIRDYIVPDDKSSVLLNRDYRQNELRILGHYENGELLKAYKDNPNLDIHTLAQTKINKMLVANYKRKPIKTIGFGLLYGMGIDLLGQKTDTDAPTAKKLKQAYLAIFPGLKKLISELQRRGKHGEPIRTWGGRQYYVEPKKIVNGAWRTFEYKLLNVLIQGSAADCTKQAIINYDKIKTHGRFILTVHDEIMITCPKRYAEKEMALLQQAMLDVDFDVPMLSDGKAGRPGASWAKLKKVRT